METNTQPKVEGLSSMFWYILIGLCFFILLFSGIQSLYHKRSERNKEKMEQQSSSQATLSSSYTKYYTLSPGETIRIEIPSKYYAKCDGGGAKYYFRPQNGEAVLFGDGQYHDLGNSYSFFDLYNTVENKKIDIAVTFTRRYK